MAGMNNLRPSQFNLRDLCELLTITALLLALGPLIGVVSSVALAAAACGFLVRCGWAVILTLPLALCGIASWTGLLLTLPIVWALCAWAYWRNLARPLPDPDNTSRKLRQRMLPDRFDPGESYSVS